MHASHQTLAVLRGGLRTFELRRGFGPPDANRGLRFGDFQGAKWFLQGFWQESDRRALRRLLGAELGLLDHQEVIGEVARRLTSGGLHLIERQDSTPRGLSYATAGIVTTPPPAPPRQSFPSAQPTTAPKDPPTFAAQDRQAAVLRQASADGTPFCEECEKRKRERAAGVGAS